MFMGCKNIIYINFIYFNMKYITNLKGMFNECNNLIELNLSSFNTNKVTDMSFMFNECNNLILNRNKTSFPLF